jgi:hypothetical protein
MHLRGLADRSFCPYIYYWLLWSHRSSLTLGLLKLHLFLFILHWTCLKTDFLFTSAFIFGTDK